jgi:D-serine deaminase-like pyridoxal phosphate-dependent protein
LLPPGVVAAVAALRDRPIAATEKGFGIIAARGPVTSASLGTQRPSLFGGGFPTPLLVLRESAVAHNIAAMAAYCAAAGVRLAPHGKTTMAPQLMARQLAAGAWAVTAATIGQVLIYRAFGIPRVLLANELTDAAGISWLADEMAADPGFDCYLYVDSLAGVALLDSSLRAHGASRPVPVLVELGYPGGRTGCRDIGEAMSVAEAAEAAPTLALAGAAGYEGGIGHDRGAQTLEKIARYCRTLRSLGEQLAATFAIPGGVILSAGGSAFFDVVVQELTGGRAGGPAPVVVLRSGVYVAFDHGLYAGIAPAGGSHAPGTRPSATSPTGTGPSATDPSGTNPPGTEPAGTEPADRAGPGPELEPALELWAHVLSRPEPGLALACAGRRDVSFDAGLPVPLRFRRAGGQLAPAEGSHVSSLDDQHAYVRLAAGTGLAPGDLVCLGVSHPCTTFDKWRVIPVVDDGYHVIDAVHTFF